MMSGMAVPPDDHSEIVGVRGADDSERDGLVVPFDETCHVGSIGNWVDPDVGIPLSPFPYFTVEGIFSSVYRARFRPQ